MRARLRAALALLLCGAASPAGAARYWVGGRDPVMQQLKHLDTPADYMGLFAPGAPWQRGLSHLSVFSISTQLILRGTPEMLHTIFDTMHRRGVAIAFSLGAIARTPDECGGGEYFIQPDLMDRVGRKLQRVGLQVDYWSMDEPVWGAHVQSWDRRDCQYPVADVARRAADSFATLRRYVPGVQPGEIEVVAGSDRVPEPRRTVEDYAAFQRLFRQDSGVPIAYLQTDTVWQRDWEPMYRLLGRRMHQAGMRFGVIVGTGPGAADDAEFVDSSMANLRRIAADPDMRPDDVIVYSWQVLPSHMLPETGDSATGLLLRAQTLVH